MSVEIKGLGDGELALADALMYGCPSGHTATVDNIVLVNRSGSTRTINLYKKRSGRVARLLSPYNFQLKAGYRASFSDEPFQMGALDQIRGSADAAGVDFMLEGREFS